MKAKLVAILTISAASLTGASASSATLIQQSHQLEGLVSQLRTEFREHYSHTTLYRHLINDAAQIERGSDHIHQLAHNYHASTAHVLHDLSQIDALAHHMHKLVDAAETRRYGHVHGCTLHVHDLMDSLTRVIHRMEATVRHDASCAPHGGRLSQGGHTGHDDHSSHGGHTTHDAHAHDGHGHARRPHDDRSARQAEAVVEGAFQFFRALRSRR